MRVDGWQLRLDAEIQASHGRAFTWLEHDCCQFAARCVKAITGVDYAAAFGHYTSESEAFALVEKAGGFEAIITAALGPPKLHVSRAVKGDIVLCDMGMGPQPAVCLGVWCVAPGARNLEKRMTASALKAWGV